MATPCPAEETLSRFDEGSLAGAERASVLAHVEGCDGCRQVIAALAALRISKAAQASAERDAAPRVFDRYRVLAELGRGAVGRVYLAEDLVLGRKVALKVVHGAGSEAVQLLVRESRAVARLSHRNVITLHDVTLREGWGFLAMEYLDGGNLATWLQTPRALPELLGVFQQAAEGLAAAHRAGLVHRDFKPANVLLATDGRVCVSDFGLARVTDDPVLATLSGPEPRLLGTPAYMAPEQLEGAPATPAADQFAFFVALHEAVAGSRPFEGASVESLRTAVREARRRVPPRPVPAALAPLIDRGLRHDPSLRFSSMDDVARALAALRRPDHRRRTRLAVAGAAAVALALAAAALWPREPACPPLTGRDAVWTGGQRDAVAKALAPDPQVSAAVLSALDESATRLDAAWSESCSTPRPVAQRARQQLCLADVLSQLDVAAQALASVPKELAPRALPVVRTLPEPGSCANLGTVSERQPPPVTEPERSLVREGQVLMLEAEALRRLGRYPEALERLGRAKERAERSRVAWLVADALRLEARLRNNTGEYELAEKVVRQAVTVAQGTGDAVLAGRVAFSAGFIECLNLAHTEHCDDALRLLEESAARRPVDELLASAAELRAGIAGFRYDVDTAIRETEVAQRHWQKVPLSIEDQLRTRYSLVVALYGDLRTERALAEYPLLVRDAAAYWGPDHARTLQVEGLESRLLLATGRWDEVERVLAAKVKRVVSLLGPQSVEYADLLSDQAQLLEIRGRPAEALEVTKQASLNRPELAFQLAQTWLLQRLGRLDELRALGRRLEAEFDWRTTEPTLDRLSDLAALFDVYEDDDATFRELVKWGRRALAARPVGVLPNHADQIVGVAAIELAVRTGDLRTARAELERCEALMAGRQDAVLALALASMRAELTLKGGDPAGAAQLAATALESAAGWRSSNVGALHLTLGEALLADRATRAQGCDELRLGLEVLEPFRGVEVKRQRALVAKCPPARRPRTAK